MSAARAGRWTRDLPLMRARRLRPEAKAQAARVRAVAQKRSLGARGVVLGQGADALEQGRGRRVEILTEHQVWRHAIHERLQ